VVAATTAARRADYVIHPHQVPLVQPHRMLFAGLPNSVPAAIEHFQGLYDLYNNCRDDCALAAQVLADQYPVDTIVHDLLRDMGACYERTAEAALIAQRAYIAANPSDVQRNTRPRTREEWNNVPEGGRSGDDMAALRAVFADAHRQVFTYRLKDPPDLAAWLAGLYPMYNDMAQAVRWTLDNRGSSFPGAGAEIAKYWDQLANTYGGLARGGAAAHEGYEDSAADVLRAHRAPRAHEHLTNVGRD